MNLAKRITPGFLFFAFAVMVIIIFGMYYYLKTDAKRMFVFMAAVCIVIIAQYVSYTIMKTKGAPNANLWTFTISVSLWGLLFLFIFPPLSVPDETYHYQAAYQLSDVLMLLGSGTGSQLPMRGEDIEFLRNESFASGIITANSYNEIVQGILDTNVQQEASVLQSRNENVLNKLSESPFQARLAPAIGITLGRILGLNGVLTFYCGRICSLTLFVVLTHFALKALPIGRTIMATVVFLPMTLHLAASYSYDSFILGTSFLLTALILDAIFSKRAISWRNVAIIAVLSALLAPCKVIYSFIIFLFPFVKPNRFKSKRDCTIARMVVFGSAILSVIIFKGSIMLSMATGATNTGETPILPDENRYYNIYDLASDPVAIIAMYPRTIFATLDHIFRTMVGSALGWFQGNIQAPLYIIIALYAVLFASCIPAKNDKRKLSGFIRVIAILIPVFCWIGVMSSMLVGWTFSTANTIDGLQGRYLLPVLPLLLLAFRPKRMGCGYNLEFWCPFCMCTINAIYILHITASVLVA